MKRGLSLIILLFVTTILFAQVSKTVNCTAGALSSLLTVTEKSTVTNLAITGTIDARDFKTMRDSMVVLENIDLSECVISKYIGKEGTSPSYLGSYTYLENSIPDYAFSDHHTALLELKLKSVKLSTSFVTIGIQAFTHCKYLTLMAIPEGIKNICAYSFAHCFGLNSVSIPSTVNSIGKGAFASCTELTSLVIKEGVDVIEKDAFYGCSNLHSVTIPSTVSLIGEFAFSACTGITSLVIQEGVTIIQDGAFSFCIGLVTISLPSTLSFIGSLAFERCFSLQSIFCRSIFPVDFDIQVDVFYNVNKAGCTLYVPHGSIEFYRLKDQWGDFENIVEMEGLFLTPALFGIGAEGGSLSAVITSSSNWSVTSDQSWITLSSLEGESELSDFHISAGENTTGNIRNATLTFLTEDQNYYSFPVTQYCSKIVTIMAGNLSSTLTFLEKRSISDLKIIGTIDARDFKIMRDEMPNLENVDLSESKVLAYSGIEGTVGNTIIHDYPANEIPYYAFFNGYTLKNKNRLKGFIFPPSITSIWNSSFYWCNNLSNIIIPQGVVNIEYGAFGLCGGGTSIYIPSSVESIGKYAFESFNGIITVDDRNRFFCSYESILFDKDKRTLIQCPTIKSGSYIIPSSVISLGGRSFTYCDKLTSVTIPSSVSSIGEQAFVKCTGLTNIISCTKTPIDLNSSVNVFYLVDSLCKLSVPFGSRGAYQAANQWKNFQHIVEMPGVLVDTIATIGSEWGSRDSLVISSNTSWRVSSDSPWLSVTPAEGRGSDTLVFVAKGNPITSTRTGLVTLSGDSIENKVITITQDAGIGSTVAEDYALGDSIVMSGEMPCFNAYDTITVAGDVSAVEFRSGSSVDLIAGSTIRFLPGFHALEGSVAHAWITTDGTFCDGASGSIVQNPQVEKSGDAGIDFATGKVNGNELKVYPNPNRGKFTIELLKVKAEAEAKAEIEIKAEVKVYNALGERVYQAEMQDRQSTIDLTGIRRGLYVVMVTDGQERFIRKVMVE